MGGAMARSWTPARRRGGDLTAWLEIFVVKGEVRQLGGAFGGRLSRTRACC